MHAGHRPHTQGALTPQLSPGGQDGRLWAEEQLGGPAAAAAAICGEAGFPSFNLSWRVGERKKKIANLLRRSEMSKMVESRTDPAFDESQSKGTFALWSEIFKNIAPCKMTMEKKMYERKD